MSSDPGRKLGANFCTTVSAKNGFACNFYGFACNEMTIFFREKKKLG